jgi:hypothetical protein
MKYVIRFAFLSVLFVGGALPTIASQDVSTTATTRSTDDEVEEVRLSVGREDEYDAVIADLALEGEQLQRFNAANRGRIDNLKAFVAGDEGKRLIELREALAAARRAKKPSSDIAELRKQIQPLSDAYWSIRNSGRIALLETLNEAQLKQYAGASLLARTTRGLEKANLTDEQWKQARQICNEAAAEWFKPGVVQNDPYFRELLSIEQPTRHRIVTEVLRDEQRASLSGRRATTAPAMP